MKPEIERETESLIWYKPETVEDIPLSEHDIEVDLGHGNKVRLIGFVNSIGKDPNPIAKYKFRHDKKLVLIYFYPNVSKEDRNLVLYVLEGAAQSIGYEMQDQEENLKIISMELALTREKMKNGQ